MVLWTVLPVVATGASFFGTIALAKKHRNGFATLLGFLCAILLAATFYLSVAGKPLYYANHQTKEVYQEMVQDRNVSSFRVYVDGRIVNRVPECDDEHPFPYRLFYDTGETYIETGK